MLVWIGARTPFRLRVRLLNQLRLFAHVVAHNRPTHTVPHKNDGVLFAKP